MGLVVEGVLRTGIYFPPEGAVDAFLEIPKECLSEPYELTFGAVVVGEVLEVREVRGRLPKRRGAIVQKLVGKEVKFFLDVESVGRIDRLCVSEDSWPLFESSEVLPGCCVIKVKLTRALVDRIIVEIFPGEDRRYEPAL